MRYVLAALVAVVVAGLVGVGAYAQPDPSFSQFVKKNRGRFTGPVQIKNYATGSEPAVSGEGWLIYDSSLNQLTWYTGAAWVTAGSMATSLTSIGANTIDLASDVVALTIEASAGQTANLLDFNASGGTSLAYVENDGSAYFPVVRTGDHPHASYTIDGLTLDFNIASSNNGMSDLLGVTLVRHVDTAGVGSHMVMLRSRGVNDAETVVVTGDTLGLLHVAGYDGTDYDSSSRISFEVEGTVGNNRVPGLMRFFTGTDAAPSVITEAMRIDSTQRIGMGVAPLTNMAKGDLVLEGGSLVLNEIAAPTADSGYGKLWTDTNNELGFQDGDGNDYQVTLHDTISMYFNANAVAQEIETANTDNLILNCTVGHTDGDWTFSAGATSGTANAITAFADAGGGETTVTDAGHGRSEGAVLSIRGTTSYNGVFVINDVTASTFDIVRAFVADDATGDWDEGCSYTAGAGDAGEYSVHYDLSAAMSGGGTNTYLFTVYKNAEAQAETRIERLVSSISVGAMGGHGVIGDIVSGDKVTIAVQSDGTNNVTFSYGNVFWQRH